MSNILNSFFEQETLLSTLKDNNFNIYSLVWLDSRLDIDEYIHIQESLGLFIDHFQIFNESDPCEEYIKLTSVDVQIILIANGNLGEQLILRIHQLQQIFAIYVYCMNIESHENWTKQYKKIHGVHNQLDNLINHIKTDRIRRWPHGIDEPLSIMFFHNDTNNEKSTMELNGEFLQTQLLFDCLNRMKVTDTDKDKLVMLCKEAYKENQYQQVIIDEFKNTYSSDQAIRWYTRDSFLYRLLNKALRVQNIDLLFRFRFFIDDIEKQLKNHQYPSSVILYRGQVISKEELKLFEESNNKLISVASFFSTSLDSTVALSYIDSNINHENLQSVLFEIHADPSQNQSKPFADISSISYFPDEQEVLMMLGSVFRIDGVDHFNDTIKRIRMTLYNHNDQNFNLLFDFMRKKNCIGSARLTNFGRVLIGMAKFDAAENHFKCLLRTFSSDHPDLFNCYQALGKIYCEKCDFDQSLEYFKIALDILYRESILNQIRIAFVHNNIGEVYQKKGDTNQALKSFQQALEIFSKKLGDINENVAWCFNNIGIVYLMEKKYSEALTYLQKAFNLKRQLLPEKHPCLGNTYTNLGNVYCHLHNYDLALNYYQESYEIFQTSLTQKHPSIARALKNIGVIHELKGNSLKASIYYNKALNLRQQILHSTHPDLLEIKQDIQRVLSKI
ncbi:unnamed protein product [Rotaria sordida]|uniref:ADP ribosyltransferase domain-containing protein n=1 Tax=Rotaria sordida TaxID=392033 RepID=A0A814ZUA1_9BILA|nr:unnamed protein product [Rotaria sordida]CAF1246186.1 unnamed protein product [Rotaria sordida]